MNNRSTESSEAKFCPTCGCQLGYVMPPLEEFACVLPGDGWLAYFWVQPDDPTSTATRSEKLAGWGITKWGEVHPWLMSEKPDAFEEDTGGDFAFLAPTSATHGELRKIRREAHAERERAARVRNREDGRMSDVRLSDRLMRRRRAALKRLGGGGTG